jgi:pimeloyl-ACP methyl ester carboxylesterase
MFGTRLDTGPVLFATEQRPTRAASPSASQLDLHDIDISLLYGCHVVVCVHGFQGSHYDLRIWRQCLSLSDPDLVFLMSSANEDRTGNSIVALGAALAHEVVTFCSSRNVMRLSFIAHSLGGLITREAIGNECMEQYRGVLHTLVTLGSPHLGYLFNHNALVDSAMWVMKKVKSMPSLHQLAMTDVAGKSGSYLCRAASQVQLNRFRHIVLVASPQDGYVPFYSARMEVPQDSLSDRVNGPLIIGMANALLAPLVQDGSCVRSIARVEAQFLIESDGVDKRIGRAAHIMFLDNTAFIQMFVGLYVSSARLSHSDYLYRFSQVRPPVPHLTAACGARAE